MTRNLCNQNQCPASKPKWEITKITRVKIQREYTVNFSQKLATQLPKPIDTQMVKILQKLTPLHAKPENQIRSTALEPSVK